ncbi:hypothetical protein QYF61_009489 [Mycteria americana]|uniref:Armadillo repeat-containing domain-containing protein n=1 Tax=Mycteria americana TaxID=33587 RepID=A0AAN7Q078_MYCAM|nr:hypothetical protein QYF61_009489 [Mycteria americana]
MGEPRRAAVRAAAIVLGAGACYCLWRLAAGGRRGQRAAAGAARDPPPDNSPPVSTHTMDADALQKLIHLLQATDDPLIQEQALITLGNSAAFSVNQIWDILNIMDVFGVSKAHVLLPCHVGERYPYVVSGLDGDPWLAESDDDAEEDDASNQGRTPRAGTHRGP